MNQYLSPLIAILGFTVVAIASAQIATYFRKVKLPLVTGLLLTGIIFGPFILNLIPLSSIPHLEFINDIALAYIAFAASAELYLREMRSRISHIKWMTLSQLIFTFSMSGGFIFILSTYIPFMSEMPTLFRVGISALFASIFTARSPASAIAVVNEMRAKGDFVQTAIGVTVLVDVLVILLFSFTLEVCIAFFEGIHFDLFFVGLVSFELVFSVGLGLIVGYLLILILKTNWKQYYKTILILLLGYLTYVLHHWLSQVTFFYFNHSISIEPLLVCLVASFRVTNYSVFRSEFLRILEKSAKYIYIPFFLLAGSMLKLDLFMQVGIIAFIMFFIRLLGLMFGGYIGGTISGDPPFIRKIAWMPYVTQAGVGLGLATVVAKTFPTWGDDFSTIIISVIVINQILGPAIFKWAISKVKEGHIRANTPAFDGIKDAIIFGFETQSVALARQLIDAGWKVKLATLVKDIDKEEYKDINIIHINDLTIKTLNKLEAKLSEAVVLMLTDKENLKLCNLIYEHIGTDDIIVRLNHRYNFNKFHELGALIVDPSTAIVSLLDHFVRSPQATSLLLGMQDNQDTLDIHIVNPDMQGVLIRNLRLPSDIIILSVQRNGNLIISHGYTRLRIGDSLTMVGSKKSLSEVSLKFEY